MTTTSETTWSPCPECGEVVPHTCAAPVGESRIYLSSPDMSTLEERSVLRAVRSGWIAPLGPELDAFEAELAVLSGRKYAVGLSSGTAALHLGLLALGVGEGDVVVVSTLTFAATANAVVYTGARPVFVDSDASGNMDPDLLETALATLADEGQRVAAVVPVDLMGKVADHARIREITARRGIPVLSDAAEAFGATRDGRPAAAYGDMAVLSFNGNKVVTTSGGGALLTDDAEHAQRVRHLATQARVPIAYYEHTEVGYNYRLSNVLAALGRAQLVRLPQFLASRRAHREQYRDRLGHQPGISIFGEPWGGPSEDTMDNCWLTTLLVDQEAAGVTSEDLRLALDRANIEARPMWNPMHRQPAYKGERAFITGVSDWLFASGLSLPSGSALDASDIDRVCTVLLRSIRA